MLSPTEGAISDIKVTVNGVQIGPIDPSNAHIDPDYISSPDTTPGNEAHDFGVINVPTSLIESALGVSNLSMYATFGIETGYTGGTVNTSGFPGARGLKNYVSQVSLINLELPIGYLNYTSGVDFGFGGSGGPVWIYDATLR
jgi:hypothetical protein